MKFNEMLGIEDGTYENFEDVYKMVLKTGIDENTDIVVIVTKVTY